MLWHFNSLILENVSIFLLKNILCVKKTSKGNVTNGILTTNP